MPVEVEEEGIDRDDDRIAAEARSCRVTTFPLQPPTNPDDSLRWHL
jgi:hypothetical protein